MDLGHFIRTEREKQRWNRTELAQRAGVSISAISRIEAGEQVGHFDTMIKIAKALDLDVVALAEVFLGKPLDRTVYPVDLSWVEEEQRPRVRQAIDGVVAPFRRSPTVNPQPSGEPSADSQRLEQLAVPVKPRSYMAVA